MDKPPRLVAQKPPNSFYPERHSFSFSVSLRRKVTWIVPRHMLSVDKSDYRHYYSPTRHLLSITKPRTGAQRVTVFRDGPLGF